MFHNPNRVIDLFNDLLRLHLKLERAIEGEGTLTSKQMVQRLPITLAQVKIGNTSKNVYPEIDKLFVLCIKQFVVLCNYDDIINSM